MAHSIRLVLPLPTMFENNHDLPQIQSTRLFVFYAEDSFIASIFGSRKNPEWGTGWDSY